MGISGAGLVSMQVCGLETEKASNATLSIEELCLRWYQVSISPFLQRFCNVSSISGVIRGNLKPSLQCETFYSYHLTPLSPETTKPFRPYLGA